MYNGRVLYKYSVGAGGTFNALKAVASDGSEFWPSNAGGIRAEFLPGLEKGPTDEGVRTRSLGVRRAADTLITQWRMTFRQSTLDYEYRMFLSGRTLVLRVAVTDGSTKAIAFHLDRSLSRHSAPARRVVVPYLTLFNLMLCNDDYVSMFFDWEVTNCSRLVPYPEFRYADNSVNYSQYAEYGKKTDGTRNVMKETIYLTVSHELNEVLPNLPGPTSTMKRRSANKIVLSYFSPFPWLLKPPANYRPHRYKYLDSLKVAGVESLAVIIKNWNNGQFDNKYPVFLPPDDFDTLTCEPYPGGGGGGLANLLRLKNTIRNQFTFDFALHENYVDFFENAQRNTYYNGNYIYNSVRAARKSNGDLLTGFERYCNGSLLQIPVLKPSWVLSYVREWSGLIKNAIGPNWSYLDVHTAIDPGVRVDFDASPSNPGADSAGMFLYTLTKYREIAKILRTNYGGPVQGEGLHHFLYVGHYDDFDGRIATADPTVSASTAPLFVDFDLQKMHPKSTQHGVGHMRDFLQMQSRDVSLLDTSNSEIEKFVATELAFGHGGLVTKSYYLDQSIAHAQIEYRHLFPMQQAYLNATVVRIEYWDLNDVYYGSASDYIRKNPGYAIASDQQFMARVKVTYGNGVEVFVNRSDAPWKVIAGVRRGWFTYNVVGSAPKRGIVQNNEFVLKSETGWVCYNPLIR